MANAQIPMTNQIPISNDQFNDFPWSLVTWALIGHWCLAIGHFRGTSENSTNSPKGADTLDVASTLHKIRRNLARFIGPKTALTIAPVQRVVDVLDLLGRKPVNLDTPELQRFLAGKNVLVTGAGGSIGSEICRQAMKFCPG